MIRSRRDLELAYWMLHMAEQAGKDVVKLKKEVRAYHKRESERLETEEICICDYGIDGRISLVKLPDWIETKVVADMYFREFKMISYTSAYGCTGREFTCRYKIFRRGNRFCVYHRIGIDV